jgi:ATP-dependent DNA ligase
MPDGFPIEPPVEPMLAKIATELPAGDGWLFEPKWDGFRAAIATSRPATSRTSRSVLLGTRRYWRYGRR